jgi:hypothetical protein
MTEEVGEEPKETEKFVIVPLGEEAKRITQVIYFNREDVRVH